MSNCKLCGQAKPIMNSHIIPEYYYKPVYEGGLHRLRVYKGSSVEYKKYEQKGIREKLLCNDCEQKIGLNEKYAKEIIYGPMNNIIRESKQHVEVQGVDYVKFKLFQLSVLWRAGISKHKFFSEIELGPHEKIIRKMIYNNDPGKPYEYGCDLILLSSTNKKVEDGLILSPFKVRIENIRGFRFIFGGCIWTYFVPNSNYNYTRKNLFIDTANKLILVKFGEENTLNYLNEITSGMH